MLTWFQPVVRLETGRIVGMEALARMRRPNGEVVPAGAYPPGAGRDQHLEPPHRRDVAARDGGDPRLAPTPGIPVGYVGVNVTAFDLARGNLDRRLLRGAASVIASRRRTSCSRSPRTPSCAWATLVTRTLSALKTHGVRIALDDFGTGYASLTASAGAAGRRHQDRQALHARNGERPPGAGDRRFDAVGGARAVAAGSTPKGIERGGQAARPPRHGLPAGPGASCSTPARPPEVAGALLRALRVSAGVPATGPPPARGLSAAGGMRPTPRAPASPPSRRPGPRAPRPPT